MPIMDPRIAEALSALRRGEPEQALALLDQAVEAAPGAPEPAFYRAVALVRLGRPTEALRAARRCLADNVGYTPALELIARLETARPPAEVSPAAAGAPGD